MMVIVLNMDWFVFLKKKKKKAHFALNEPAGKYRFCSKALDALVLVVISLVLGLGRFFLLCRVVIVNAA